MLIITPHALCLVVDWALCFRLVKLLHHHRLKTGRRIWDLPWGTQAARCARTAKATDGTYISFTTLDTVMTQHLTNRWCCFHRSSVEKRSGPAGPAADVNGYQIRVWETDETKTETLPWEDEDVCSLDEVSWMCSLIRVDMNTSNQSFSRIATLWTMHHIYIHFHTMPQLWATFHI